MNANDSNEETPIQKLNRSSMGISDLVASAARSPLSDLMAASAVSPLSGVANPWAVLSDIAAAQQTKGMGSYLTSLLGSRETEVESEVAKLRQQIAEKEAELTKQNAELGRELQKTRDEKAASEAEQQKLEKHFKALSEGYAKQKDELTELQKRKDLGYLLGRVCIEAAERLLRDKDFVKRFEEAKRCNAFVLAIDIRRSTDLMLRGKTPKHYADFLNNISSQLVAVIKDNYGVVDKFTGDGLLAYFPEFFTGLDAGYRALAAAEACHSIFVQAYREARSSFTVALKDVGLGIGIDFGEVHVLRVTGELTVVGAPVVYACRLSGALPGHTYMNHSAVAELAARCPKVFATNEVEFDVKHEGLIICQDVTLAHTRYEPSLPDWLVKQSVSETAPVNKTQVEKN